MMEALLPNADKLCKEFPYFDMAYIAKAITNNENTLAINNALLFTQNNMWLNYIINKDKFDLENKQVEIERIEKNELSTIIDEKPSAESFDKKDEVDNNVKSIAATKKVENEGVIPIEPYYTVDYFAAQGVKMQPNLQPTDKLGIQVKSFTEWLKTMRKMPIPNSVEEEKNTASVDNKVVILAENSLLHTETLTETMAEVLVKQGRINDAIKVFEKLSLQDTTKSAYFAKRITDLNN